MKFVIGPVTIFAFCFSLSFAAAQNKVVVVPLWGKKCTNPVENSFTNSLGMTFNLIPAGTFNMGSPESEPGHTADELQHQVMLTRSFYMQVTEVTNEQWNAAIAVAGGANPSGSHAAAEDEYPVENVNWYEAAAFANGLSTAEGLSPCYDGKGTCTGTLGVNFTCSTVTIKAKCTGYRLPTEAQWEYAARAGTMTAYANPYRYDATDAETGFGFSANLAAMGWYIWNNTIYGYEGGSKPMATQQANRWGLYDMHGNVWEWCQDWHSPYSSLPVTDPQVNATGTDRVMRGGSWISEAGYARSAVRGYFSPMNRNSSLGFRMILIPGQ